MEKYYIAQNGIQKGPWSLDTIAAKLTSKEVGWNDYIYDQKLEDWVLLLEFATLTPLFNKSFKNPIVENKKSKDVDDPVRDRAWYILKQNNNYGPFSKNEMVQMLQSKTLFEYDFIWRKDQDSWKRLADVEEFSPDQIKSLFEVWSKDRDGEVFYRRRHERAHFQGSLIIHDRKKIYKAHTFEISPGGAGLIFESTEFPLQQELHLHFRPNEQVPAFNATCKIVNKSGAKYGVQFIQISTGAREFISKFTKKAA